MSDHAVITLDTPNYRVRTLTPDDANESWTKWLLEPTAIQMLNARRQTMSVEALRAIIKGFDSKARYLFGIFDKASGELVGIRAVYVDLKKKEWVDNVLIGPVEARRKGAHTESTDAVGHYFFEEVGLAVVRCTVVADNKPTLAIVRRLGLIHEQTTYRASKSGAGVVELLHFRLNRETWRQNQRERALRSA